MRNITKESPVNEPVVWCALCDLPCGNNRITNIRGTFCSMSCKTGDDLLSALWNDFSTPVTPDTIDK